MEKENEKCLQSYVLVAAYQYLLRFDLVIVGGMTGGESGMHFFGVRGGRMDLTGGK